LGVRIPALIRTLADMGKIRRKEAVKWLVDDVARSQDAPALEMLHAFTKRIMPKDSKENPADVFERIRQEVGRVRSSATAVAAKAAKAARAAKAAEKAAAKVGKAKKKKKAKARARAEAADAPTGGRANRRGNQSQRTHQTAVAGPSSGDATQAAKGPTTAEKGATMFQAYDAL
jgi:hypothetical protein